MKYGKRIFPNVRLFWIAFPVQMFIFISFYSVFLLMLAHTIREERDSHLMQDLKNRSTYIQYIIEDSFFTDLAGSGTSDRLWQLCRDTGFDLTLFTAEGEVVFNSYADDLKKFETLNPGEADDDRFGSLDESILFYLSPLKSGSATRGYLRVSVSRSSSEAAISRSIGTLHFRGLIMLLFTALFMSQFFRIMIKTVTGIKNNAINIANGKYESVMPPVISRELSQLSDSLSFMANEIEAQKDQLKKKNDDLHETSMHDPLTGLGNRRRFEYFFSYEWSLCQREQHSISLILMDIDYFKYYNDTLGHPEGDVCLQKISTVLSGVITRSADILIRLGGGEFAVLLPETEHHKAMALAEKVLFEIALAKIPHPDSPVSRYVSMSLGVHTMIPKEGTKKELLYEAADQALYKAKHEGRNRIGTVL